MYELLFCPLTHTCFCSSLEQLLSAIIANENIFNKKILYYKHNHKLKKNNNNKRRITALVMLGNI